MIVAVFLCGWRWRHLASTIKNSTMSSACEKIDLDATCQGKTVIFAPAKIGVVPPK